MSKTNTVAKITKWYAIINAAVCVLFAFNIGLDEILGVAVLAAGFVVNFGIYALGEVIQLLEDIKNNTAKGTEQITVDEIPDI